MPLINGLKMACEPCIRGHRSTKCTHANERLMVPVRKPGRPLSQCPHPGGQSCGCGSVTAAIPRKQPCHCGSGGQIQTQGISQPAVAPSTEMASPTRANFKVQKSSSRPASSRKQSFDISNLERMNMNQVNVMPSPPTAIPTTMAAIASGYPIASPSDMYDFAPQYPQMKPQYNAGPMRAPSYPQLANGNGNSNGHRNSNGLNIYTNGDSQNTYLDQLIESPTMPATFENGGLPNYTNKIAYRAPLKMAVNGNGSSNGNNNSQKITNGGGSCCGPKPSNQPHNLPNINLKIEPQETKPVSSCCAPKLEQPFEPKPMAATQNSPQISVQAMQQNGMNFNPALWPQFGQEPTVFTYPPTYGTWQNPLQLSVWRQNLRATEYSQLPPSVPIPYGAPVIPESNDTVHTCGCGDGCECVGCAAHPYNAPTIAYMRSACDAMNQNEPYNNGHQPHSLSNGRSAGQAPNMETISSPTTHSPSSTTSGNGEDQNLSAGDFFFVRYPLHIEQDCLGDDQSCPCGDECECLGCTIHRQPITCAGTDDTCLCGDECECIGCEIHKGGLKL